MKQKLLTIKSLLVAVLLGVGVNGAWAVTETYALQTQIAAGYTTGVTTGNQTVSCYLNGSTEATELTLVKLNSLKNSSEEVYSLGNHIYLAGWSNNYWWIRTGNGYNVLFNNKTNQNQYIVIGGLSKGDEFSITGPSTLAFQTSNVYLSTDNNKTNVTASATLADCTKLTSGATYVVSDDALGSNGSIAVALKTTGSAVSISAITVTTSAAETMGAPTIRATGANGINRTVTITPGVGSGGSDATATYYTTDGTEPSSSNGTSYTAPFNISETTTIKAISYLGATVGEVTTTEITAGTTLQLNAPAISLTSFTLDGTVYNPTYTFTSNQNSIIGKPVPTISYSFNSGSPVEASSYSAKASGSITVTVSADGYESNETVLSIVGGDFVKIYSFDAINDVTVDTESGEWGNSNNVNGAQWTHTALSNCTYTLRADISLTNFLYARATTAKTKQGFYARAGAGTISYTLNTPEFIQFTMLGGSFIIANGSTSSQGFEHYSNVRAIDIFAPATVSVAISAAGKATYVPAYNLDFSGTDIEAYKVKVNSKATATLTKVDEVPAGTPVLLIGTTDDIPVIASAAAVSDNDLVAGTGAAVATTDGEYTNMVLAKKDEKVGFFFAGGKTVAANRAYLHIATTLAPDTNAPMMLVFDGETTGVNEVRSKMADVRGEFYNLAGQRVAQPTKGLYIVNGKKVVIK